MLGFSFQKKYIFPLFFLLLLVLVGLSIYFSYQKRVSLKKASPPPTLPQEKETALKTDYDKLKESASSQEEIVSPNPNCFQVKTNPTTGVKIKSYVDSGEGIYDFTYIAQIIDFQEIQEGECQYYQITLSPKNSDFQFALLFPQGLYFDDENLGKISGEVFKDFVNYETEVRLKMQQKAPDLWQILSWDHLKFYIN